MEKPSVDKPMTKGKNTKFTEDNCSFLLAEYERLSALQQSASDIYQRRFDIYLAVFSAAVVGYLTLADSALSPNKETITYVILITLIIVGITIFTSMASISTWQVHLERAMRLIQDRYTQNDHSLKSCLYFNNKRTGISGTGFLALFWRGVLSGGPKTILVFGNSISISLLSIILLASSKIIQTALSSAGIIIGIVIFLLSGLLHVLFAKIMYKIANI